MGKRFVAAMLAVLMLLTMAPPVYAGFVRTSAGTVYTTAAGKRLTGLQKINGRYYYFNSRGVMQTGVVRIGTKLYYFSAKTGQRMYGWIRTSSATYYAKSGTGVLLAGCTWGRYTFGWDGKLITVKNGWVRSGGKTYYYQNGKKVTGLVTISGKKYYFARKTGAMQKNVFIIVGGNKYYLGSSGYALTNRWLKWRTYRYFASSSGALCKGIVKLGNYYYYFNTSNARMVTNSFKSWNGNTYYLQAYNGRAITSRQLWLSSKIVYYFDWRGRMVKNRLIGNYYYGSDGKGTWALRAASGLTTVSGKRYFFDEDGRAVTDQWYTYNGARYYLGSDGAAYTGMRKIGDLRYIFGSDGVLVSSARTVYNGVAYRLDPEDGHILEEAESGNNLGQAIADYGKQFVGNPYVYGGNSLTSGTDCSGFTSLVLAAFGFRIPRVANDQMQGPGQTLVKAGYTAGKRIADRQLQPGDLVFYGSGNYASHAAIYIGNNQVVHACNSRVGIVITSIDYVHGRLHDKNMRYWS